MRNVLSVFTFSLCGVIGTKQLPRRNEEHEEGRREGEKERKREGEKEGRR
jgi:hypothetical protein